MDSYYAEVEVVLKAQREDFVKENLGSQVLDGSFEETKLDILVVRVNDDLPRASPLLGKKM